MIVVNTARGTMVNKHYVPTSEWSAAQFAGVATDMLADRDHLVGIAPTEIKSAFRTELDWYAALKANNWDKNTTVVASGLSGALTQLGVYQRDHCGISLD
jgi:hypothetical protein